MSFKISVKYNFKDFVFDISGEACPRPRSGDGLKMRCANGEISLGIVPYVPPHPKYVPSNALGMREYEILYIEPVDPIAQIT